MLDNKENNAVSRYTSLKITQRSVAVSIVRIRNPTSIHLRALGEEFERDWPVVPNTAVGTPDSVLWLGPQEWAVTLLDSRIVEARVASACHNALWDVSDMSPGYALFEISGAAARSVMAKSCPLDLHPRVFCGGRCAQTVFAQVAAIVHQPQHEPRYCVYFDVGLTHYVQRWLAEASAEYLMDGSISYETTGP